MQFLEVPPLDCEFYGQIHKKNGLKKKILCSIMMEWKRLTEFL